MCKVEAMLKYSLTGALTWAAILQPFMKPTWTLESFNVKIAGNRGILPSHTVFKELDIYNAIGLTNQNTTVNFHDTVKQTKKQILQD